MPPPIALAPASPPRTLWPPAICCLRMSAMSSSRMSLDFVGNQNWDTTSAQSARSRTKSEQHTPRPKSWKWQYNQNIAPGGSDAAEEVQQFVGNALGAVANGGWWKAAQDMAGSFGQGAERKEPKTKAGRSAGTR